LVTDKIDESWDHRWSRVWKIEKMGDLDTEFWFNFSEAGIPMSKVKEYGLLYTDDLNKDFETVFDNGRPRFGNLSFTLENDALLNGYYTIAERESSTGINTFYPDNFEVYPNPFQDYLNIKTDNPGTSAEIKILDLTGRTIKDFGIVRFSGGFHTLNDLQNIGMGYFILNIRTNNYQLNIPLIKNTK
jgi:hypothetical protein